MSKVKVRSRRVSGRSARCRSPWPRRCTCRRPGLAAGRRRGPARRPAHRAPDRGRRRERAHAVPVVARAAPDAHSHLLQTAAACVGGRAANRARAPCVPAAGRVGAGSGEGDRGGRLDVVHECVDRCHSRRRPRERKWATTRCRSHRSREASRRTRACRTASASSLFRTRTSSRGRSKAPLDGEGDLRVDGRNGGASVTADHET